MLHTLLRKMGQYCNTLQNLYSKQKISMRVPSVKDHAPCPCGNNKSYADCHKAINEAFPNIKVNAARKIYLEEWRITSQHLYSQDGYKWAADQLAPYSPQKLFDIGCGVGYGLSEIIKKYLNIKIIAIDENRLCLNAVIWQDNRAI